MFTRYTYNLIYTRERDRQIDRQTGRQTDRQRHRGRYSAEKKRPKAVKGVYKHSFQTVRDRETDTQRQRDSYSNVYRRIIGQAPKYLRVTLSVCLPLPRLFVRYVHLINRHDLALCPAAEDFYESNTIDLLQSMSLHCGANSLFRHDPSC